MRAMAYSYTCQIRSQRKSPKKISIGCQGFLGWLWILLLRITIDATEMLNCLGDEKREEVEEVEPNG
jgi:hypothetical protein